MPKTKDAFAFRRLYDELAQDMPGIPTVMPAKLNEYGGYESTGVGYMELEQYFFNPTPAYDSTGIIKPPEGTPFELRRRELNNIQSVRRNVRTKQYQLDRHLMILQRYVDAATGKAISEENPREYLNRIARAKDFISRYMELLNAFYEYESILKDEYREYRISLELEYRKEVGLRLRKARNKKGLSQASVAAMAEITTLTYGRYELGTRDMPTFMVYRLSKILEFSPNEILNVDE